MNDQNSKDTADTLYGLPNLTQISQLFSNISFSNRGVIRMNIADNTTSQPTYELSDTNIYDNVFTDTLTLPLLEHRSHLKQKQQAVSLV
ncbi:hypothetical protein RclHR1_05270013 [Rhizophagus clarus]|uniref:Uncharacterized protein n=1 Tax=Rhizophagus clarus TaxID=94130 RepID=A0A2Z6RMK8_9GLOM|nr:hypothetical protein RclHR1_05270013 [Rhizophagus clarus]GES83788.1 hypothetical protein RCL_jg9571.t1 [Rhizophagus clarus]